MRTGAAALTVYSGSCAVCADDAVVDFCGYPLIATTAVVFPAFLIILLIMVLLKKALQNKYVKAALGGLKPCIIGIILSTGILMMIRNCNISLKVTPDVLTIGLTCFLAAVYFGSRKFIKKGISPIMLICVSALVGVVAYGIG